MLLKKMDKTHRVTKKINVRFFLLKISLKYISGEKN